jgi:hypothetical protein
MKKFAIYSKECLSGFMFQLYHTIEDLKPLSGVSFLSFPATVLLLKVSKFYLDIFEKFVRLGA